MLILKLTWICASVLPVVLLHEFVQILRVLWVLVEVLIRYAYVHVLAVLVLMVGVLRGLAERPKHPVRVIIFIFLVGLFGVLNSS